MKSVINLFWSHKYCVRKNVVTGKIKYFKFNTDDGFVTKTQNMIDFEELPDNIKDKVLKEEI